MARAPLGKTTYWNSRICFDQECIDEDWDLVYKPSKNPVYRSQYVFDLAERHLRIILRIYSSGGDIGKLDTYFSGLLQAWELSNHLSEEICNNHNLDNCRDWNFELNNLNHYIWCFWLVGLAITLDIPENQWSRLINLIGTDGQDELLDRLIATRQPGRKIGTVLLHPKPYKRLLSAVLASEDQQPELLKSFVEYWYKELNRPGHQQPYWYLYGDPDNHPLDMGSYFGRWCIEAAAVAKAFNVDDSLCLGHEHYPGDLLRPNGPTTHNAHKKSNWLSRFFNSKQ